MADMTASELADRLGVTVRRARDLLAVGEIAGRQLANRTWLADSDSVIRYQTAVRPGSGRQLGIPAGWALLWELSGLEVDWLARSTRARVRRRIRESSAEQIARAVAKRTTARRFTAANVDKAQAGLIATGRAAAGPLGTDLIDDRRRVSGYVRQGSVDDYAGRHFMLADAAGQDVLLENTLPIDYDGDVMPPAVVAADLATSLDTRERSAGLTALEDLRQAWLAVH